MNLMTLYRSSPLPRLLLFLVLTMLLISVEMAVTRTPAFNRYPIGLSIAVLFDLVCVTTGLFYGLVARPRRLATSRLIPVALLMLRLGLFIVPQTALSSTPITSIIVVLAEGAVFVVAVLRIQTISRTYRQLRPAMDADMALQSALASVFGNRAAGFILGEGLTFYYVLLGWRLQSDIPTGARTLTTHRQSGQVALTIAILVIGAIEAVAVHLLIARWHPVVAGWLTALSGYGMLFFVADLIATLKRPSYLTPNRLNLRLGIRWRIQVDCSMITDVSAIHEKLANQANRLNGSFLTAPNVSLLFREPVTVIGPFGIRKPVRQLTFFVDDQPAFMQTIREQAHV